MNAVKPAAAKLTLGPLLYNWPAERRRDFYFRVADEAPVDAVHVGEVVCAKRVPLVADVTADVVERLLRAGKAVIHSTAALVQDARDEDGIAALAADPALEIEANDMAGVALMAGRPHVIGPLVNVYNEDTLAFLAGRGAVRFVLPAEHDAATIAVLAAAAAALGAETEVQAFGRLPLAISARCYHARAHGLHKDGCQYVCGEDPDGMAVETLDGQPFLAVNGTQTQSWAVANLCHEMAAMCAAGVGRFRLWPQAVDMVAVAQLFRDMLDGRLDAGEADGALARLVPFAPFANGFYHGREGVAWDAASSQCELP
jgi:collagenase-like PrtC family protease